LELLERSFDYLTSTIGVGPHGLLRIRNGDWNDSIVYSHLTTEQQAQVLPGGESVLNAAMASYVFDYYAVMLDGLGKTDRALDVRQHAEAQRTAVRAQWTGRWYRRAWLDDELGWVGEKQMWLEPQPWALIGGCVPPEEAAAFASTLDELVRQPSPIGALLQSQPDPTMKDDPGTATNAGIFSAINGTLIWALAQVNGAMAWDEWQKNTLARHADVYPTMWFGIWSGPDAYNSVFSKWPGGAGVDFPVLNMHPHAWPLYTAAKLLGTEFNPQGVRFRPLIPLAEYEFVSPLLGFSKTAIGYSGWYAPTRGGTWAIDLELPGTEQFTHARVNGVPVEPLSHQGRITLQGTSAPDSPLRWELG
jgi:hypothetical protein